MLILHSMYLPIKQKLHYQVQRKLFHKTLIEYLMMKEFFRQIVGTWDAW